MGHLRKTVLERLTTGFGLVLVILESLRIRALLWVGCCLQMGSSMIHYFNKSYLEGEWTKVGPKLKLVKKQQSLISQERRVFGIL